VASLSVRPRLGMTVPGFAAGGSRIQRLRSSGPLFGSAPPAIVARLATPVRSGPTAPLAPGMPGMMWQPPQPFWIVSVWPSATAVGSGVGTPGLAAAAGDEEFGAAHAATARASVLMAAARQTPRIVQDMSTA